jgi:predicted permease
MLGLFVNNLLPIFLAAGAGYLLASRMKIEARPIAHIAFYIFAPCLVFRAILDSDVPGGEMLRMLGFSLAAILLPPLLAWLVAWRIGWSRRRIAAVVLVVLLPNAANYGLSANLFAFGEEGLANASLFFITASTVSYTLGVFIASMGGAGIGAAIAGLWKVPAIWGVAIAFAMLWLDLRPPFPVERTIRLLSDATIPAMLVVLGMQLCGRWRRVSLAPWSLAVGLRMLGGCAGALLLASLFGLEGAARQAGILQASMPSAVLCIILATEYDLEPELVTSVVFLTTLLSPLTLTPLLLYLS